MRKSIHFSLVVLIVAGGLQALAYGICETALPLYLEHLGLSYARMSVIFSVASLGVVAIRLLLGAQADASGRKPFLNGAMVLSAVASFLTPLWGSTLPLVLTKTTQDLSAMVRDIMRSVLVFELSRWRFVRWIGRVMGTEFFAMALGAVFAGSAVSAWGFKLPFFIAGGLSCAAALCLWRLLWEPTRPKRGAVNGSLLKLDAESWRLPYNLRVLSAAAFVFNIGLSTSHSFYMLLFFKDKFGFQPEAIGVIQMLHRFSLGLPMLLTVSITSRPGLRRHYKTISILSMAAQGVCISTAGLLPAAVPACALWVLHDVLGAAIFSPINAFFTQSATRPDRRASDVALTTAVPALGMILGPILAAWLLQGLGWTDGPFAVSGAIMGLSSLILLALRT